MFQVMNILHSSNAKLLRHAQLGDALEVAWWQNQYDATGYLEPGHHTLSVYVEGGQGTRFVGKRDSNVGDKGEPWRYCLLPADHESSWLVDEPFKFLHLYLSPKSWADRVVRLLDSEPRAHSLEQRIFCADAVLANWAKSVHALDWTNTDHRLFANQLSHDVLDYLVLQAARPVLRTTTTRIKGGLSTLVRRRLIAYIEANLADNNALSLGRLAEQSHLSEFHMARMFRISMGCSIREWIVQKRVSKACQLLAFSSIAISEVAQQCGFHSVSHLYQVVRENLRCTPTQIRESRRRKD